MIWDRVENQRRGRDISSSVGSLHLPGSVILEIQLHGMEPWLHT